MRTLPKGTTSLPPAHARYRTASDEARLQKPAPRALAVTALLSAQAAAYTGIRLITSTGDVVFTGSGKAPGGKPGMRWTSRYACLGTNGEQLPYSFDGLNEKGLAVGTLSFPATAGYQIFSPASAGRTLPPWELGSWLLEILASVEEVRRNIDKMLVADVVYSALGFTPPVPYIVNDASGKSIVIDTSAASLTCMTTPSESWRTRRRSTGT